MNTAQSYLKSLLQSATQTLNDSSSALNRPRPLQTMNSFSISRRLRISRSSGKITTYLSGGYNMRIKVSASSHSILFLSQQRPQRWRESSPHQEERCHL